MKRIPLTFELLNLETFEPLLIVRGTLVPILHEPCTLTLHYLKMFDRRVFLSYF